MNDAFNQQIYFGDTIIYSAKGYGSDHFVRVGIVVKDPDDRNRHVAVRFVDEHGQLSKSVVVPLASRCIVVPVHSLPVEAEKTLVKMQWELRQSRKDGAARP